MKTIDGKEIPRESRTLKSTEDFENCSTVSLECLLRFVDDETKRDRRCQITKEIMCQAKDFWFSPLDIEGL